MNIINSSENDFSHTNQIITRKPNYTIEQYRVILGFPSLYKNLSQTGRWPSDNNSDLSVDQ